VFKNLISWSYLHNLLLHCIAWTVASIVLHLRNAQLLVEEYRLEWNAEKILNTWKRVKTDHWKIRIAVGFL
jgi:cell division protein FtsL